MVELTGDVVVVVYDALSKQHLRTLKCKKAKLYIEGDELAPTLTMEVYDPIWQRADGEKGMAAGRTRIRGLIIPQSIETVTNKFRTESSLKAVELASQSPIPQNPPGSKLEELQKELRKKIQKTLAVIKAEMHSRLVFGVGCVSMIMIGIGLGVIFKGGHLLSAFGASCVPAALLIVCILMGKNLAKNLGSQAISGTVLMWAGLIFMTLLATVIHRKLLKN
ncbi:MAG: LptF/LptG family permease [Planctomycetota bacterium]